MPFPIPVTSPQQDTLRTSGYWNRPLVALLPVEIVFRARAAESLTTSPFIEFLYDSVDTGNYTDCFPGMVAYISATDDIRDAKYRGRVRIDPTSTVFAIDLNATILNVGDRIIVTRDVDLFSRERDDNLADSSIPYHPLPPQTNGLPSCIVLYDALNVGFIDCTTVQTGIVVDAAASTIDSWAWDVSGAGVSSIDDATLQNPTITFTAGYHYLLRVIYIDDLGTSNYQIVHVYAVMRNFTNPVIQSVVAGSWEGDLDDGWTANLTAYADVSTLIDRTHCVLFQIQHFGDNSSTPIYDNILMCGRIRSDSIQTEGNAEAGVVSQVSFTVEGLTAYLRRLRIPNDIIRPTSSPDEWGEITSPTPYRMAVYEFSVYTTLCNLGSFGVEADEFEAWTIGGEPRGIDGGYALDVLTSVLSPIKAAPNWAPSGEIFLALTTSYRVDRSSVVTVVTLTLDDMLTYNVNRDSSRTIAQVIAFGGAFNSASNTFDLYSAQSPSIVYGDGGETRELTREILAADASIADAASELSGRASNEYAYNNPKPTLSLSLYDSWCGVLIPTNYLRYAAVIPASSNTLGIAYSADDYWQLQSVSNTINSDGTVDTSGDLPAETVFSDAQVMASLLPINLTNMNPVLPILPNDPAFPTDPLENYPTDNPDVNDLQPIDPFSGLQAYTPFSPDIAAQIAAKTGKPKCFTMSVLFKNSSDTSSSPRTTALGTDYLVSLSGTTVYSTDEWSYTGNFLISDEGFVPFPTIEYGMWVSGMGWVYTDALKGGVYRRSVAIFRTIAATTITYISFVYDITKGTYFTDTRAIAIQLDAPLVYDLSSNSTVDGTNLTASWAGTQTGVTGITLLTNAAVNLTPIYDGYARQISFTMRGLGTNPFTGLTASPLSSDAFYVFDPANPDTPASVLGPAEGFFLDNTKFMAASIPPYSKNHVYNNQPLSGTNNVLLARMQFNSYGAKSYLPLNVEVCPK